MFNNQYNYHFFDNKAKNVAKNCKVVYDWISISTNYMKEGLSQQQVMDKVFVVSEYRNLINGTKWLNGKVVNTDTNRALWVSASDSGMMNISVCPPKFIHGNNIDEASIVDTLQIFTMLSDMVGYDLGATSFVRSVDITHTAMTEYDSVAYYPYLCHQTGKQNLRWKLDSTLYYGKGKSKQKKFYDKVRDANKTGGRQDIPAKYIGNNMTRFEVTLGNARQVSKAIGEGTLLGHLFTMEFVDKLHNYWVSEYTAIPKLTELSTNFEKGMKLKGVQDEIIQAALAAYGRINIENDLERAAKMDVFSYSDKSRAKKKLLKPFEDKATKHDLIKELDTKILGFEPTWE